MTTGNQANDTLGVRIAKTYLRAMRLREDGSVEVIAAKAGIPKSTFDAYKAGRSQPDADQIQAMAGALGWSAWQLIAVADGDIDLTASRSFKPPTRNSGTRE